MAADGGHRKPLGVVRECAARLRSFESSGGTQEILATLDRLKAVRVTPNVLRKTEVGKLINSPALLQHADLDVRQRSSALVASWRQVVKNSFAIGGTRTPGKSHNSTNPAPSSVVTTHSSVSAAPPAPTGNSRTGIGSNGHSGAAPTGTASSGGALATKATAAAGAARSAPSAATTAASTAPPAASDTGPRMPPAPKRLRLTIHASSRAPSVGGGAAPPVAIAPADAGAALPPLPYEAKDPERGSVPSGPTAGPVPRTAPGPNTTNQYAPEGARPQVGRESASQAVPSRPSALRAGQVNRSAGGGSGHGAAALDGADDETATAGAPSAPSASYVARGGGRLSVGIPGRSPRFSLLSVLTESVPYPMRRGESSRRKGRRGYFCYENFKTGECSRGESCPFPHLSTTE